MAAVDIEVEQFSKSDVPPVCVFSGVPSENVFRFRFDGVTGGLPVNDQAIAGLARLRKLVLGLAAASVLCFAIAVTARSTVAAFLAVGFMAIALAVTISARRRLVRGRVNGGTLSLSNVHPGFVRAVMGLPPGKCTTCPTLADCPGQKTETPSDCVNAN